MNRKLFETLDKLDKYICSYGEFRNPETFEFDVTTEDSKAWQNYFEFNKEFKKYKYSFWFRIKQIFGVY